MSEWWTYSLSDFLLFSPRTYYRLFELYNAAIWPMQVLTIGLGLAILALVWRGGPARAVALILAACWAFVAWAYLIGHYDTINWAASYFAVGFVIQTALLVLTGVIRNRLSLRQHADTASRVGFGLLLFALVVKPLIAPLLGRPWTQAEIFGIAPDPTVVATLGILAAAERPHWLLLIVPLLWCAVSGATLWTMESPEAPMLPAVAVVALGVAMWKSLRRVPA
jgi:Family of unknown function (DUF6064)